MIDIKQSRNVTNLCLVAAQLVRPDDLRKIVSIHRKWNQVNIKY